MQIGPYHIWTLETGRFALDGGAMFGVVPKTLWQKAIPADDLNRIPLALRTLLMIGDGRVILVDTGIGDKFPAKQQAIFAIDTESLNLKQALAAHDLSFEDVTDVILTHLHFDHAGGATYWQNDRLQPRFPQARYWIQQRNWEWAQNPSEKDRASYLKENFEPLMAAGQLYFCDENEFLPGISAWISDGHTIGQQLIRIHDAKQSLIYCADIIPTSAHLTLPWIMGYDLQPLVTLEEKRKLLQQAAQENWVIVFEHDPFMDACRVQSGEKGVVLSESLNLALASS